MPERAARVAFLTPMKPELRPLVKKLALERRDVGDLRLHRGSIGDVEVVAAMTGIGTRPGRETTERVLRALDVDHVVVVGVAGGVGPTVEIGDVLVPEVAVDEASGTEHRPTPIGDLAPRGRVLTSDRFGYPPDELAEHRDRGVIALDMETSAIGAVCEQRGVPWSAFRAISDRGDDDRVDIAMLEMAGADGSGDLKAVARYLLKNPLRIRYLAKLARDSTAAANAAAQAAIDACAHETRGPRRAR